MESINNDELLTCLHSKRLISRHQHVFLSRRSTGTQLIDCLNDWTLNIENKQSLDTIYIDVYVNDVSDILIGNTACKLFANDIKLYSWVDRLMVHLVTLMPV